MTASSRSGFWEAPDSRAHSLGGDEPDLFQGRRKHVAKRSCGRESQRVVGRIFTEKDGWIATEDGGMHSNLDRCSKEREPRLFNFTKKITFAIFRSPKQFYPAFILPRLLFSGVTGLHLDALVLGVTQ